MNAQCRSMLMHIASNMPSTFVMVWSCIQLIKAIYRKNINRIFFLFTREGTPEEPDPSLSPVCWSVSGRYLAGALEKTINIWQVNGINLAIHLLYIHLIFCVCLLNWGLILKDVLLCFRLDISLLIL